MRNPWLEIRTAEVSLGGQVFTVAEFSGLALARYLEGLAQIKADGSNLIDVVDGVLGHVLGAKASWLHQVDVEEKLAALEQLKPLNDLDKVESNSSESNGEQVTWDEACDVVGARYSMSPIDVWSSFPPRLIRRFYFHAVRAVEREHWFFRRLHGDETKEPRWLYGDPDELDERKQLASKGWRDLKARHEAMRGRRREPVATSPISG